MLFFVLAAAPASQAGLAVLEGEHTVVYDIVNPRGVAFIPDYSNESFEQKVIGQDEFSKRVRVTSKMHPVKSRVPYPIPAGRIPPVLQQYLQPERDRQSHDAAIQRSAQEAVRGSRYAHEAANAILSWIADHLTFDTSITVPSDAVSALRFRRAYCVGYSNLAVAMLRAAGIPARVAHGYLPPGYEWGFSKEYWGVKVNDGGFHAYLEIYMPDTGWAFSDAEHSHLFVDPYHIILSIDGMTMPGVYKGGYLDVDKATFYTIYKDENRTLMVDELPRPREKRLGRRLDNAQHSGLVTGRVKNANGAAVASGTAVLWKDGRGEPTPFIGGRYALVVAQPGTYRVELRGPGYAKSSREVVVAQGASVQQDFTLQQGGVIRGKVTGADGRPVTDGDVFYRSGDTSFGVPIGRDGKYVIEGLVPGQYTVKVLLGEKHVSRTGQVRSGGETVLDFVVK